MARGAAERRLYDRCAGWPRGGRVAVPPAAKFRSPWKTLYALIWLVFVQILIVVPPLAYIPYLVYLHVGIGFVIVAFALYHQAHIIRMAVPARIRRIVRATANLASAQFFLGIMAFLAFEMRWALPGPDVLLLLHLVVALSIFSQASSTATAYDMWEEREFERVETPAPKV